MHAPGPNREALADFSVPNTTQDGMNAVEEMEMSLIAKPHYTSKQVWRKRIGAAITFVASTVATVMLTRYLDKGSDCTQFDAHSLSTKVGYTCDHAEDATMASGTVCVVQCNEGYRGGSLLQSTITCTSEGIWSGSPPICEAEVCTQGTAIADSPTHCVGKTVGHVCDYECNMGFTVTGVHLCTLSGSTNQREMSGGSCVCGDDHYAFQLNEEPTRCLAMVTMQAAGFTADSTGIFSFKFSGSIPSDLKSGAVTVPATAALSLTGTGAETIGASFTVEGSLSVARLSLESSVSLVTVGGASLSLSEMAVPVGMLGNCGVALGHCQSGLQEGLDLHDVQLTDADGQVCQSVNGSAMSIEIDAACLSSACTSSPCQNGGTCSPTNDGYTCDCALGYGGPCSSALTFHMFGFHNKAIPSCSVLEGNTGGSSTYPVQCIDDSTPDASTINDCAVPGGNCEIRFPAAILAQLNASLNDSTTRGCCSAMRCSGGVMCLCDDACSYPEDATNGEDVRISGCTSKNCDTLGALSDGRDIGMKGMGECDPRC